MTYLMKIVEADGSVIQRPYTEEEIADAEARKAKAEAELEKINEVLAKREAALSKLGAFGLTADDLKALGL